MERKRKVEQGREMRDKEGKRVRSSYTGYVHKYLYLQGRKNKKKRGEM